MPINKNDKLALSLSVNLVNFGGGPTTKKIMPPGKT